MSDKKPEFVVSDRRRFAPENESRATEPAVEEERDARISAPSSVAEPQATAPADIHPVEESEEEMPPPPTAQEQREQDEAYKVSGKKIDQMISQAGGRGPMPGPISFEGLIESFYMSALVQMGAVRREGEQPRVDIIGARQTIDTISLLQDKTRGNLSEREQVLLQNVLFELRMAWIEITNAIAQAPAPAPGASFPGGPKK